MSFNATVPLQIHDLRKRLRNYAYDRIDLAERNHFCDCDHCPISNPLDDDEYEVEMNKINQDEKLTDRTLKLLILYATEHNIKIPEESKR